MNIKLKIVLNLCTIFLITICFGQKKSNFIKLDKTFSQNAQIVEDRFGYIRISSSFGLYKYDGYNYSLIPYTSIFDKNFTSDKEFLLTKDSNNNLWFSSYKGELTKIDYNGVNHSYKYKLNNDSIPVQITAIKQKNDNIWFGSINGSLYKYNDKSSEIDSITTIPKLNGFSQKILSMAFSKSNEVWMSTKEGKIYYYSTNNGELYSINNSLFNKKQAIRIANDNNGQIWLATELDGLFSYKSDKTGILKQYNKIENSNTNKKHDMFISIFCDSSGNIWAGTDGDGLYNVNTTNDDITIYKYEENNKFSISNNTISYINEDTKGNIWIITKKGLVNILPKINNKIQYYNGLLNNTPTTTLSVLKSTDGSLYIGTDGKGLNKISPNNTKAHYNYKNKGAYYFEGKYIQNIVEDAKGNIWLATYQNGLWVHNPKLNTFTKIKTSNSKGFHSSDIRTLFKDSKNRIWVTSDAAINIFSDNLKLLATYDYDSKGLFGNNSMAICEDENNTIWIGINPNKLYKFNEDIIDLKKSYFTKSNFFTKKANDLNSYNIHDLKPDYNGFLWILCASGKLIKYNLSDNTYKSFANKDHFKNINISSILIENPNNLWLSSSNGIHHYNLVSNSFTSYYQIDGFQSTNFRRRSSFKDSTGVLYFGGEEGVNAFFPSQMNKKETNAKLYINAIEILNKPANLIVPNQVKNETEFVKELKLDYEQSSFSFQFAAIDNILHNNYHYAYKLNGFDKNWITPNNSRIASYTNIPYGNYTFQVKAGSKRGEWNIAPVSINISIKPPWWHSNLAYLLYFISAIILIYGITLWLHLKNKLVKETWENNKEKELYALKMNFFAKMSHEIQTPLTLITGPISDMLQRAGANGNELLRQRLLMINNNANRLSRIAMELMTVRNKELGKLRIYASKNNVIKDLKRISQSFTEQARFKNIDFIQKYSHEDINIWYDADKIEHVMYNLLSNAFKFTPKEGKITLKATLNSTAQYIEIKVKDSGPGIPKNELEDIFKLFYQSDLGKHTKGTGIGLALTKELISLHKGKIDVKSSPKHGTSFCFKLSTKENLFSEEEKINIETSNYKSNLFETDLESLENKFTLKTPEHSKNKYTLLIVEDNIEMQMFLQDVLNNNYKLLIAENGKVGLNLAKKHIPDLIISDVMMPEMNGLEMCKQLQKKKSTVHIPVILLTAKNTKSTKIKALQTGAIEYINKPFNFHELTLKVSNILSTKEKLLEKYKTDAITSPKEIVAPSKDDIFMEQLVKALQSQIENTDFKLEDLSKILNMSYSVIYRKCQDITGKTIVEFVRVLKLKKAALLIIQHNYNVSEASFMVGYKDSKYFTKCFKEEFGIPPAKFKKESKEIGVEKTIEKYKIKL